MEDDDAGTDEDPGPDGCSETGGAGGIGTEDDDAGADEGSGPDGCSDTGGAGTEEDDAATSDDSGAAEDTGTEIDGV